ncbi:hypothetical protein C0995_000809 [Termitomyces sp. Mi166|nr:hypothetical protein C0995_000809 [Termitomyces sp. Mi166\
MLFEAEDAQLAASFSLKFRSAPTVEEVIDEDCPEPSNPESIHQSILMDFNREKSVSTPPNSLSPQANPILSHATTSEQLPQLEDNTAQSQDDADVNVPAPETKLEDQILHKVISPEYHEYANMFSEGSAKELPPHCL